LDLGFGFGFGIRFGFRFVFIIGFSFGIRIGIGIGFSLGIYFGFGCCSCFLFFSAHGKPYLDARIAEMTSVKTSDDRTVFVFKITCRIKFVCKIG
jgi:hypothetical protein